MNTQPSKTYNPHLSFLTRLQIIAKQVFIYISLPKSLSPSLPSHLPNPTLTHLTQEGQASKPRKKLSPCKNIPCTTTPQRAEKTTIIKESWPTNWHWIRLAEPSNHCHKTSISYAYTSKRPKPISETTSTHLTGRVLIRLVLLFLWFTSNPRHSLPDPRTNLQTLQQPLQPSWYHGCTLGMLNLSQHPLRNWYEECHPNSSGLIFKAYPDISKATLSVSEHPKGKRLRLHSEEAAKELLTKHHQGLTITLLNGSTPTFSLSQAPTHISGVKIEFSNLPDSFTSGDEFEAFLLGITGPDNQLKTHHIHKFADNDIPQSRGYGIFEKVPLPIALIQAHRQTLPHPGRPFFSTKNTTLWSDLPIDSEICFYPSTRTTCGRCKCQGHTIDQCSLPTLYLNQPPQDPHNYPTTQLSSSNIPFHKLSDQNKITKILELNNLTKTESLLDPPKDKIIDVSQAAVLWQQQSLDPLLGPKTFHGPKYVYTSPSSDHKVQLSHRPKSHHPCMGHLSWPLWLITQYI